MADKLAARIRELMQSEPLSNGDVFRTEAQLATEFGVSRTIVREAVSRLRALGILEGCQGKGLVVCRPDLIQLMSESLPSLARSEEDFRELIQLRYVFEVGGIELAVNNATEAQIEKLAQIAEEFSAAAKTGADVTHQSELDLQFHVLLLEMTHSALVAGFHNLLARFFATNASFHVNLIPVESGERTAMQHFELVAAIRDRDVERARFVIRSHIHCYLIEPPALQE